MSCPNWSLEELNVWRLYGRLDERIRDLLRPHQMSWPSDELELAASFSSLQRSFQHQRRHLLPQSLVAAALSRPHQVPDWAFQWLRSQVDLGSLGLSLSWEIACSMKWMLFPTALADESRGLIYRVLAGYKEGAPAEAGFPTWWPKTADEEALKSVRIAMNLLGLHGEGGFHFLPIIPFTAKRLFHGTSLGLPFYLAGYGLCRGFAPEGILATGGIGEDGSLLLAGGLPMKAAAASGDGLKALLCPLSSETKTAQSEPVERIEVESLQEACFIWELYKPGEGNDLQSDFKSMADTSRLAANAHLLSKRSLSSGIVAEEYSKKVEAVLEDRDLARQLLDNLERMADSPEYPAREMDALLAPFSPERARSLAAGNPVAAFRAFINLLLTPRVVCDNRIMT
jgi:hypothetical protein